MTLDSLVAELDRMLNVDAFDDVSNNGLQIARSAGEVTRVAVAVDASLKSVRRAVEAGAELLIVHHGLSWGGGIKRIDGPIYEIVKTAISGNLALYACHLPLDAHPTLGNNAGLVREEGLTNVRPAFSYHGNVIGFIGEKDGRTIGVCSGGAGEFATEAKKLKCDLFITGEANWAEKIAAENCGMTMECRGHYETEVYGVRSVGKALAEEFQMNVYDLT